MTDCYIICGPHRGGTSLVAGICHALGLDLGPESKPADEFNPTGYFEDPCMDPILMGLCGWRDELSFVPTPPDPDACDPDLVAGLFELVNVRTIDFANACRKKEWGFKSNYAGLSYPVFARVYKRFGPIHMLNVVRDPDAVAKSHLHMIHKQERGIDPSFNVVRRGAVARMEANEKALSDVVANGGKGLVVDYDHLIAEPKLVVGGIAEFLGRPVNGAALNMINPKHKHF